MIESLNIQVSDLKNKNDQKTREIEKLKEEIKRKEKGYEDKLNLANSNFVFPNLYR